MTDFIDVLQSCMCVCVSVCGCRNGGSTPGRWCRKSKQKRLNVLVFTPTLVMCVLFLACFIAFCAQLTILTTGNFCLLCMPARPCRRRAAQSTLPVLATIPVSHKCDSNSYAAFMLKILTSGGFTELKKGIEGRTIHWASCGPVPLRIT